MDFNTFQNVVRANTPFDKGAMQGSWQFFDTPYRFIAIPDIAQAPHFVYQQEGTRYFQGNKGFVEKRIIGMINKIAWSETLGLPYDYSEVNKTIADRNNSLLQSQGFITR